MNNNVISVPVVGDRVLEILDKYSFHPNMYLDKSVYFDDDGGFAIDIKYDFVFQYESERQEAINDIETLRDMMWDFAAIDINMRIDGKYIDYWGDKDAIDNVCNELLQSIKSAERVQTYEEERKDWENFAAYLRGERETMFD